MGIISSKNTFQFVAVEVVHRLVLVEDSFDTLTLYPGESFNLSISLDEFSQQGLGQVEAVLCYLSFLSNPLNIGALSNPGSHHDGNGLENAADKSQGQALSSSLIPISSEQPAAPGTYLFGPVPLLAGFLDKPNSPALQNPRLAYGLYNFMVEVVVTMKDSRQLVYRSIDPRIVVGNEGGPITTPSDPNDPPDPGGIAQQ